jgi:hypothetical protein
LVRNFCVFSNNPLLDRSPHYRSVSSRQLLRSVRDLIHRGAVLVNHPLYGNFRPYQQPFRTLIVEMSDTSGSVDFNALSLIERALAVYDDPGVRSVLPGELDPEIEADYAYVDGELVRESLRRCGLEGFLSGAERTDEQGDQEE